ncbi:RNase P subunit p30 family protein [Candidatus Halobonum tyrrellensis]|uniref:Ribonuclease P protein component 3 n=1 Tax=Candidatus Halobonum tyrrellensis G22 TaxID=1324957 RepID=V4HN96_9EURY|nr:RNase P subunit p30 family protein [Candidatus Halobonum tyrrellensis]ESP89379.1 ribonuclease P protein component 3 [Candidatus Halobonum tyrrellensis G22]
MSDGPGADGTDGVSDAAGTDDASDDGGTSHPPYEAVTAHPEGDATVSRYVRAAREYGFGGVVVRTRGAEFDADALESRYGVDVVPAVEIAADAPDSASGSVGNFRPEFPLLSVRGGTDALNRFAVEQDRVDVLARPMAGDGDFNHVLAKAAATHGTRVEFDFGPVLRASGGRRVKALKGLRKLRELVFQYDAPFVVSGRPASHLELRAPRDLVAVGEAVGFPADAVRAGLAEWGRLAARNRERQSDSFISPGVRLGGCEEDDR